MDYLQKNHKEFIKINKLWLKTQQIDKSEKHNVFTEEVNSADGNEEIWSIDSIEIYACGTSKGIICKKKRLDVRVW